MSKIFKNIGYGLLALVIFVTIPIWAPLSIIIMAIISLPYYGKEFVEDLKEGFPYE